MKKILYSFMVMAIAAFTFTSCEDVPEPYGLPNPSNNNSGIDPVGDGTLEAPFNVAKVNQLMESGEYSETAIYCVQGVVSQIREVDPSYGNATFYISDDGTTANQFYVYRGYGLNNTKFTSEDALQLGDTVIVAGKLVNYNGTYEFAQGNYLVRLNDQYGDAPDQGGSTEGATGNGTFESPFNIAGANKYVEDGGSADTQVYVKGKVSSIKSIDTGSYGNAEYYISDDGRTANQFYVYRGYGLNNTKFTSEDQLKVGDDVIICGKLINYNGTYEFAQGNYIVQQNGEGETPAPAGEAKGTGTLEDPYNAVAVINYIKTLGSDNESPNDVYIKGKVAAITEQFGTQYGNATFTISDDGTAANTFTVYRALYLGNQKYTAGDLLKVGDEVIICGKVVNFRGNTPETATGKAYLYSLNGVTAGNTPEPTPSGEAKGTGTLEDPYNSVAAINYIKTLGADVESTNEVYVKGKVVSVTYPYAADQYGNGTFYISDDGTTANQLYIYRALYLGNEKYTKGAQIKVGDEVIVCGKVVNYRGNTPETVQNKAYLYSLNGETTASDEQPGEEPGNEPGGVDGNTITFSAMGYTNAQDFNDVSVTVGDATLTFSKGSGSTTPKYYNTGTAMRLYGANTLTVTSDKTIKSIKLTYADGYAATSDNTSVSAGSYDYDGQTWTLGAKSGVLSYTATGGHIRIQSVTIEY